MEINRRDFIESVGLAAALLYIPLPLVSDGWKGFDPQLQYGNYVRITDYDKGCFKTAFRWLNKEMKAFIPPGYRGKVEWIFKKPGGTGDPLFCYWTMAWKYNP